MNLTFTITDNAVTVMIDGRPSVVPSNHANFLPIQEAIHEGDTARVRELADIRGTVKTQSHGRVEIRDTGVFFNGKQVHGALVNRILKMIAMGSEAVSGYIKFLDNLYDNPSYRAVTELWGFVEACDLPVTPDGHFLAYKRVRENFTDIHSGTFDNTVGSVCEMPRFEVDEDKDRTCSNGLHFCSESYLPHFGAGNSGNKVVVVKINPADVVAIPSDYNNAKGRTWRYEVVGDISDDYRNGRRITPHFTDEYDGDDEDEDQVPVDAYDIDALHEEALAEDAAFDAADDDEPEAVGFSALSEDDVANIKALLRDRPDVRMTTIGNAYGVHRETIARIRDGRTWRRVKAAKIADGSVLS